MVMPLKAAATRLAKTEWAFYRVMYDEPSMRRAWILLEKALNEAWRESGRPPKEAQSVARREILHTLSPVLHLYKHSEYETENEVRLVYRGTSKRSTTKNVGGDLRPVLETNAFFLKAKDCRIVLGPTMVERNRRIASLEILLRQVFRNRVPEVRVSRVPYQ
jgi:hypothetical protein